METTVQLTNESVTARQYLSSSANLSLSNIVSNANHIAGYGSLFCGESQSR